MRRSAHGRRPRAVFHDVYLRGAPATQGPGRVALTFEAVTPCTATLLGRLRVPAPGAAPIVATFFVDRASLQGAAEDDPVALRANLRRIVAEGHGLALTLGELPERWRRDPAAFRAGLVEEARAVEALLAAHGLEGTALPRLWRPPAAQLDLRHLGRVAGVDRPAVLWSLRAPTDSPERIAAHLAARWTDGDIVALPGAGRGCPAAEAAPLLAAALKASGLSTVTVPALLAARLPRHEPLRVARYHGPGLPGPCHDPLGIPAASAGDEAAMRWGIVQQERPDGRVVLLPLPGRASTAAAFVAEARPVAERLWADREAWRARPACLRMVEPHHLAPPVTVEGAGSRARWWVVGPGGIEERDPRALSGGSLPVVLPTLADLVRVEAIQRLPYRLRGLVAGALTGLGLQVPLLVEARATAGIVVGRPLRAPAAEDPEALRSAIAGYVQLAEVTLAEYLYLAERSPSDARVLERVARGIDGFVRAGPFWNLAGGPGATPDPARTGPNGAGAFEVPPEALLAAVLQRGEVLRPGDVVAAAPPPVAGPPRLLEPVDATTWRSVTRLGLARAVALGLGREDYLRPGGVVHFDGDLLGRLTVRVAVPPGINLPTFGKSRTAGGS